MSTAILKKLGQGKIGRLPVVIVPLDQWREVEAKLEDYEMMRSEKFRKSIAEARAQVRQGKLHKLDLKTGKFKKAR